MGLFGGDKSKSKSSDPVKSAKKKKKTLALDQQINDLQLRKARESDDSGGGGEGDFWKSWYNTDLDPW
jgi:hypothetical protein